LCKGAVRPVGTGCWAALLAAVLMGAADPDSATMSAPVILARLRQRRAANLAESAASRPSASKGCAGSDEMPNNDNRRGSPLGRPVHGEQTGQQNADESRRRGCHSDRIIAHICDPARHSAGCHILPPESRNPNHAPGESVAPCRPTHSSQSRPIHLVLVKQVRQTLGQLIALATSPRNHRARKALPKWLKCPGWIRARPGQQAHQPPGQRLLSQRRICSGTASRPSNRAVKVCPEESAR